MFWEESNKPSWKYFEEDEENFEKLKIDSVCLFKHISCSLWLSCKMQHRPQKLISFQTQRLEREKKNTHKNQLKTTFQKGEILQHDLVRYKKNL